MQENVIPEECLICWEIVEAGSGIVLGSCSHFICKFCFVGWVDESLATGNPHITCVKPTCKKEVTQTELRGALGAERFAKLERRALEHCVSTDPSLRLCPSADCKFVVAWTDDGKCGAPKLDCPLCKRQHCLLCCSSPYHAGQTCIEFKQAKTEQELKQKVLDQSKQDEAATAALLSSFRMCPKCRTPIIKSNGCEKLMCRCGARFCYVCLSPNAQCEHTPASHGFFDNIAGYANFSNLTGTAAAGY